MLIEFDPVTASPDVVSSIQRLVRDLDVFQGFLPLVDCYNYRTFRAQHRLNGNRTIAILDRNVLTDILSLARPAAAGLEETCTTRGRNGAAVMAFLQWSNAFIDPKISLFENPANAQGDLRLFRQADNVDSEIYSRIALGKQDFIPVSEFPKAAAENAELDFSGVLSGHSVQLAAVLKLATLELTNVSQRQKMETFIEWSFAEFCFSTTAILLATVYLSQNRPGKLLKNVKARDRQTALKGVKNAAWDLQLMDYWMGCVERQKEKKELYILCSNDGPLKRIAKGIHFDPLATNAADAKRELFVEFWGEKTGPDLAAQLIKYEADLANPTRAANRPTPIPVDSILHQLERDLLEWLA